MANFNDTLPAAAAGGSNVKWQKDGSGNISAYFLKGAAQTPWTQDIDAAGYSLRNAGYIAQRGDYGHSWNLDVSSGSWRHVANGYGNLITGSISNGNLIISTSQNGSSGALATMRDAMIIGPYFSRLSSYGVYVNGPDSSTNAWHVFSPWNDVWSSRFGVGMVADASRYFIARYNNSGSWIDDPVSVSRATGDVTIQKVLACANTFGERIRIYDAGGINQAIGVESYCMYQQVPAGAVFRWYCGVAPDGGASADMEVAPTYVSFKGTLLARGTPTSPSGLPSGGIWRDAAAGNVLKVVP